MFFLTKKKYFLEERNGQFPVRDTPAGNHGSCIHQIKYPVQDDEHMYHESLQACLIDGIHNSAYKQQHDRRDVMRKRPMARQRISLPSSPHG